LDYITLLHGCIKAREINLKFIDSSNLFLPNVFSPDDDGINDFFTVFTKSECIKRVKLMNVYSRWGEQVFSNSNFAPNDGSGAWQGRFRGKKLPVDVYVYYVEIEYYDGSIQKKSGDVTLVR
jgi:gliding motility-associated-like protein